MTRRTSLIVALACLVMPAVIAALDAVTYHAVNRSTDTLVSSGMTREYTVYVPPAYAPARPAPLVISLHGGVMWPAAQQDTSQWNRVADREGFIVVYPSGLNDDGPRHWEAMPGSQISRDVIFIGDLIDALRRRYNIDASRIYANGLSNGGGMTFVLSCRMPDRFAAVGLVASAQLLPWDACADDHPVPMINFHGTADLAPYHGGKSWVAPQIMPSQPVWTALWARRNRCAETPIESRVASDVTRTEYSQCANDATVALYTIHGGGHTWPGGGPMPEWFVGKTTHTIDASSVMWEFFKAHPLAR